MEIIFGYERKVVLVMSDHELLMAIYNNVAEMKADIVEMKADIKELQEGIETTNRIISFLY